MQSRRVLNIRQIHVKWIFEFPINREHGMWTCFSNASHSVIRLNYYSSRKIQLHFLRVHYTGVFDTPPGKPSKVTRSIKMFSQINNGTLFSYCSLAINSQPVSRTKSKRSRHRAARFEYINLKLAHPVSTYFSLGLKFRVCPIIWLH